MKQKKKLYNILLEFGLTDKQARAYLASLKIGPATISDLARQADLKRTTLALILEELVRRQIFQIIQRKKRKFYLASAPEQLIALSDKKKQLLIQALPLFQEIAKPVYQTSYQVLKSPSDIQKMLKEIIKNSEIDYQIILRKFPKK